MSTKRLTRRSAALAETNAIPGKPPETEPATAAPEGAPTVPAKTPPNQDSNVIPMQPAKVASVADQLGLRIGADGNLDIASLAHVLASSRLFPDITSVSQGIVKILVGKEIGLAPMASVMGVHIIRTKGRDNEPDKTTIMIGAKLVAAKIKGSGRYDYDVLHMDAAGCELQPYSIRGGKYIELARIKFTIEEAQAAGYGGWGKDGKQQFKWGSNWAKDPQAMCFARAITRMEKVHFPDLTGLPAYTPDELGYRADADGNALTVKGKLVPDDIADDDLQKMQQAQNGSPRQPERPQRTAITGVKIARLQTICQDKGWPLLGMLDMAFGLEAYIDQERADQLWDAEATQTLLETIADDRYEAVIKALDQPYEMWKKLTEGHQIDEAEKVIDAAKEPQTKTVVAQEVIDKGDMVTMDGRVMNPSGNDQSLIDREQYDDLWAMVADSPKLIQAAKEYAQKELGYDRVRTLRDIKKKHLSVMVDFIQRWGKQ